MRQEMTFEERPFRLPLAPQRPRPILEIVQATEPVSPPARRTWQSEAGDVSRRYGLTARRLKRLGSWEEFNGDSRDFQWNFKGCSWDFNGFQALFVFFSWIFRGFRRHFIDLYGM